MEKVTFQPLKALLKENAGNLNQILASFQAGGRRLNTHDIPAWFKEVIEPVFVAIHSHNETAAPKVFDALFSDMLAALSMPIAAIDHDILKNSRLLLQLNPALTAANPGRVLKALGSAAARIFKQSQSSARAWLALMQKIVPLAKTFKELLSTGRIAAWSCGMAHLRELIDWPATINPQIAAIIFADEKCQTDDLKSRWGSEKGTRHLAAGDFKGFGGLFTRPPMVAREANHIFASDGVHTAALFADRFGLVFLDNPDLIYDSLHFALETLDKAPPEIARILCRYPDLTSWVFYDATLFYTTSSSHSVFVSGAVDG